MKIKKLVNNFFCCMLLLSVCLAGCGDGKKSSSSSEIPTVPPPMTTPPLTGTLELEPDKKIAPFTLTAGNSSHTISGTGTPLDGITVYAPPDGLSSAQTLTLHYSIIKSHTYGPLINPRTPLITVDAPNMPSGTVLLFTFPIQVSDTDTAVGTFYNSTSGELEVMPRVGPTNAVTIIFWYPGPQPVSSISKPSSETAIPGYFITTTSQSLFQN